MKLSIIPAVLMAVQVAAFAQSNTKCPDMATFRTPGAILEITRAAAVPAGRAAGRGGATGPMLPAHCRIDGMIDRRTGTDGKTYGIRFAIALPDNWTGEFLQQGGGGLNGTVGEPAGAQAAGDQPALARGFAVATTDTGHQSSGGAFDGSFMQDHKRRWTSNSSPSVAWQSWPSRSSRTTTAGRRPIPTMWGARQEAGKPCSWRSATRFILTASSPARLRCEPVTRSWRREVLRSR